MSSDKLNLQFSWTLAQGYSWFKLYALFFTGYIAPGLAKSGTQAFFGFTGIGEFVAVTFAGLFTVRTRQRTRRSARQHWRLFSEKINLLVGCSQFDLDIRIEL